MGRPPGDPKYLDEVIIIERNKKWKCKYCEGTYSGGFSRIKAHLDKKQGKGISKCRVYHNKESASSSIDPQEAINTLNPSQADQGAWGMIDTVGGSINHQTNRESSSLFRGSADLGVGGGSNGYSDLSTSQSLLNDLVSDLKREEEDIMRQLHWLESRGKKRKRKVDDWLDKLKKPKERAIKMNNLLHQFGSSVVPVLEVLDSDDELLNPDKLAAELRYLLEQKPLVLSNEFVGENFVSNVEKMWGLLGDDKVMTIGIHGMGGAGKTCLATYMHNEIKRKATFNHVFWVTVSRDFTIFKLQLHIAQTSGFKLDPDCEDTRAIILASELEKLEKTVLILDDVWNYIDLQKVGIPLKTNGIKLIITTRLKHVCRQMDCRPGYNMIEIYPRLLGGEDWELFLLKLGRHGTPATLPPGVLEVASSVVEKCDRLPFGISVMARTMKGRDDIVWWRGALENFEMGQEMKEEVLTILKRSYDNLIEEDLRNCFLHCALLPSMIERKDLIRKLSESGVLNGKRSWREIFDQAHIIVDKLIDHSLLLLDEDCDQVVMHDLVRNMACHIRNMMVKCDERLIKIPDLREWGADLEAVSLANNKIKEIRKGTSPNCPRLSALILSNNEISDIPECFFSHMNALTLLDLSENPTLTCLPNSVSKLTSLTCLVLRGCWRLEYIPPLGELQALSRLDISGCSLHQVPQGLQNLTNLKWLDLSRHMNSMLITTLPGGVLSGLTNMQYLDLRACTAIKLEDLQGMTMLECFGGTFLNLDDYNCYVKGILDNGYGSETYSIRYGKLQNWIYRDPIYSKFKLRRVRFGDCEELSYFLPKHLTMLFVHDNNQWVCLCSALFSTTGSSLKNIEIKNCTKLKSLFCLSSHCSLCPNIPNLECLNLADLKSLTAICKEDDVDLPQSLSPGGVFSDLKHFSIGGCHEIETLLTPRIVSQLQNLESIIVSYCKSMKEIFAVSNNGDNNTFNVTLPKLTKLRLNNLPELKTVCKGILLCGSEDIFENILRCPKLKALPETHRA